MIENEVYRMEEEPEEPDVIPHLNVDGKLIPVELHSTDDVGKMIAAGDKRQLLIAKDSYLGEGEVVVTFFDPTIRLGDGQGFDPKGIIWQTTSANPNST